MDLIEPAQRIGLAILLTLPLALDRELRGKEAGLRTNVIVAAACAAMGHLSLLAADASDTGVDGTRIAAQTITGIGFIGAGIIWASRGRVRGLTTAAAAFAAAAIGLVSGMGEPALAIVLAVAVLVVLWPLHWLFDKVLARAARENRLVQLVVDDVGIAQRAAVEVTATGAEVERVDLRPLNDLILVDLSLNCTAQQAEAVASRLGDIPGLVTIADSAFERDAST